MDFTFVGAMKEAKLASPPWLPQLTGNPEVEANCLRIFQTFVSPTDGSADLKTRIQSIIGLLLQLNAKIVVQSRDSWHLQQHSASWVSCCQRGLLPESRSQLQEQSVSSILHAQQHMLHLTRGVLITLHFDFHTVNYNFLFLSYIAFSHVCR